MDYSSPYDLNPAGGGGTLQPPAQPNAAGGPANFARRFHELVMPLEELMAEWRVVCQTSPELAQETLSLLNHRGNLTETRYILINSILSSVGAQPEYYAPTAHYESQPPPQFNDFNPPTTFAPPSTYSSLQQQQQQQPWIGMTLVDPPAPSMFTSILEATEDFSSSREMMSGSAMLDISMPFFSDGGAGAPTEPFPFPFLQLPTPLPTPTTSSLYPWSFLSPTSSSTSTHTPSPPAPILYTSPSIPSPSRPAHLPPLNTTPFYLLLIRLPHSSSPETMLDLRARQMEMHELKIISSELSAEEGGVEGRVVRLVWLEQGSKKAKRVFEVVQREGEVQLEPREGGEGSEKEEIQILFFDVGTYSVPPPSEKGSVGIGSGDWWRAQVCFGHHPLSPPSHHYWTSTTIGHKTRKHRVLAHFTTCTKGRNSEALKALARVAVGDGKGRKSG